MVNRDWHRLTFTTGGTRLKFKADDINTKANQLNTTASGQSNSELTTIKNTDIQNDTTPGSELTAKAQELRGAASNLHGVANTLATSGLSELQTPARNLKDAAKKSDNSDGLYKAANELESGGTGLEALAEIVIQKFEAVKSAYEALSAQAKTSRQEGHDKVTAVDNAYKQLKTEYDGMLNLTKLKNKSTALSSTAGGQSNATELQGSGLDTKATQLATKAQNLSTAADGLNTDPDLRDQATALANAAKSSSPDEESLYAKATSLATTPTQGYDKAKDVIVAFDKVKEKFDALITAAIVNSKLAEVQTVITAYDDLKNYYDTMMPFTKIRYYSEQISAEANTLLNSGEQNHADKIVRYFESMELAYNSLPEDEKNNVKTQFDPLKNVYDLMLNVNKMKQPATELDTVATTLQTYKTVANAQLFKNKYDAFEKVYEAADTSAKDAVKDSWEALKNIITGAMKRWKFWWIIGPSIVTQWSFRNIIDLIQKLEVYPQKLKAESGASDSLGLRAKANQLYSDAGTLASAIGDTTEAAKAAAGLVTKLKEAADQLKGLLKDLDGAIGFSQMFERANSVKEQYEGVEREYYKVKADSNASRDSKFGAVKSAFDALQTDYTDAVCLDKFYSIIVPSIFSMSSDLSFQTKYAYHGTNRTYNGFHGWTWYKDHQGNSNDHTEAEQAECTDPLPPGKGTHVAVYGWIWHFFGILISLAISLIAAILWTIAYNEGKEAKDGYPPPDPKQKDCTNITLKNSSSNNYEIVSGNKEHIAATAEGKCGHKKFNDAYYAYFIPPTLMVIIGILKNYDINPYVYMGNWGLYHQKVCKSTSSGDTPNTLGICSGTIVATLNAKISSATLNTSGKTLTLTLNIDGVTITIEGSDSSNGTRTLASGNLSVNRIGLSGAGPPYELTNIGNLNANNLKLSSGSTNVKIKQDTLITLKLTNPEGGVPLTVTGGGSTSPKLTGPPFGPFSLGAYKVTDEVTLKTSEAQSINTDTSTTSEIHSQHSTNNCCFYGKQYEWTDNPMAWYWNIFTILAPLKIILAAIFIYSLHYRDSNISRSIVNQPKMSNALTIVSCCRCIMKVIEVIFYIGDGVGG